MTMAGRQVGAVAAAATVAIAAFASPARSRAQAPPPATVVIEKARIHTGEGPMIPSGSIVWRGDKIAAVGAAADVKAPEGARRIDGSGLWITAGLFDAESRVGLVEVSLEESTVETGLDARYDAVRAAFAAVDGFNPASVVIPVTRMEGITTIALAPDRGLVAGRGAVLDLVGSGTDEMIVRTPTAVYLAWGDAGRSVAFGARGGLVLRVRELLDDVRQYARRRQDFERNQMRKVAASRLDLEALVPVVEGKLPLVVAVQSAADIRAVLRLVRDEGVKIILSGCAEGWMVAGDIAKAGVPVILHTMTNLPESFESLASRLENARLLHAAGVKVAISPRLTEPHNSRVLRFEAGNAAANGLPWEEALRAITRHPAEIFGVSDRMGTLSVGKTANVVVWSGDPFEPATRARHVFIRGQEIPMRSRQTELRDKYRELSGAATTPPRR